MDKIRSSNKIDSILSNYKNPQRSDLSKILLEIQTEFGSLDPDIIKKVSSFINISSTEIYGYASFYSMYYLTKPGKYKIRVCKGTACHVKGSKNIIDAIEKYLDIKAGESSKDGLFYLETVSCLGVCALAPVMMIDDKTYSRVNSMMIKTIIDDIRETESTNGR